MNKVINITILIIILIVGFSISLYFWCFNYGLSNTQSDWAAFGGYIGGIAAILNVGVFIWLTLAIKQAGESQKQKEIEHQKNLNARELEYQKKLILAQIRQKELENFIDIVNKAFIIDASIFKVNITSPISAAIIHLESFLLCKGLLFPIDEDSVLFDKIAALHGLLSAYSKDAREYFGVNNPEGTSKPYPFGHEQEYEAMTKLKGEVFSLMQEYIINELDM